MNTELRILGEFEKELCQSITRKIIHFLQGMKDTMSADDSGLVNLWDEICVQIQHEESYFWDLYDDEVRGIILKYVSNLAEHEKALIWLFIEDSNYEVTEDDNIADYEYVEEDIVEYIKNSYVYSEASNLTNRRIIQYLKDNFAL